MKASWMHHFTFNGSSLWPSLFCEFMLHFTFLSLWWALKGLDKKRLKNHPIPLYGELFWRISSAPCLLLDLSQFYPCYFFVFITWLYHLRHWVSSFHQFTCIWWRYWDSLDVVFLCKVKIDTMNIKHKNIIINLYFTLIIFIFALASLLAI